MPDQFSRTAMLIGGESIRRLKNSRVAVFGIGGVGGHCAEALCRTGVGTIGLFDGDVVDITNINRQIIATHKTIGLEKVGVMRQRLLEINPGATINANRLFYLPESADSVDLSEYDYVIDAVDTITAKLEIICRAIALGLPVISSMGAANKLDPTVLEVADIYETSVCPMARVMRNELRKRGVRSLKVVYSREKPIKPNACSGNRDSGLSGDGETRLTDRKQELPDPEPETPDLSDRRQIPASIAFVPPVAGLIIAAEVVKDLLM